jgi:hypothetical protein
MSSHDLPQPKAQHLQTWTKSFNNDLLLTRLEGKPTWRRQLLRALRTE